MQPDPDLDRQPGLWQFTLRDMAAAIYGLAVILAFSRAVGRADLGPGHLALGTGLAIYVGGCLALWIRRLVVAVVLMLLGLAILIAGALQCGGFR